jgi:hypothetical protein
MWWLCSSHQAEGFTSVLVLHVVEAVLCWLDTVHHGREKCWLLGEAGLNIFNMERHLTNVQTTCFHGMSEWVMT